MTDKQKEELDEYLRQVRAYMQNSQIYKEDHGFITDFIDLYGDDTSFDNIETFCAGRHGQASKSKLRKVLYRWKMYKAGAPLYLIVNEYTGQVTRACEIFDCPDRDEYGFCGRMYKFRSSCKTLRDMDDLGGGYPPKSSQKKKKRDQYDRLFGMRCSYIDASSAVYKGKW